MGVFSKKNKVKDQDVYGFGDSADPAPIKSSLTFKRKQKPVIAPKPQLDLSTALPDSSDFRTSMLMPQMSARFSMLREQDDPTTKVGKASDDSVLFPKRASRLNLFAHNPLTDIAEVESTHRSSFRPPFAHNERSFSISDGYGSDDGASMMSRSRPGEGNNLFGGRQKIYRIAAGATSSKTLTNGSGKHAYDDDVALSSFQQYRQKARDEVDQEHNDPLVNGTSSQGDQDESLVRSPLAAFSKDRGTTSSTTSGPSNGRTSTAATSVTCESPLPRHDSNRIPKYRTSDTLEGIDELPIKRHPSAGSRQTSSGREETNQPPMPKAANLNHTLSQSRSAANMNERYTRPNPFTSSPFNRAISPPPSHSPALASLEFGLQQHNAHSRRYQTASPTNESLQDEAGDHIYSTALQPGDRGKATALGLFNRPTQQFDEQQFLQRQRQMHEGRASPFSSESRSESRYDAVEQRADSAFGAHDSSRKSTTSQDESTSVATSPFAKRMQKFNTIQSTANPVMRPRKKSDAANTAASAANVKARVESLIRRQNAELAALEIEQGFPNMPKAAREASMSSESPSNRGTFFNGFDASDDETSAESRRVSKPSAPPVGVHPALRDGLTDFDFGEDVSATPQAPVSRQSVASVYSTTPSVRNERMPSLPKGSESPTLGSSGLGLSGLVSRHLRHDSDKSSLPPPSPAVPSASFPRTNAYREVSVASTIHTINPPESVHSDPWDLERGPRSRNSNHRSERRPSEPHDPPMSAKAQQFFGSNQSRTKAQQILGADAPDTSSESLHERSWQDELQSSHRRGESSETARERREFDDDLAERQRKIQERLKGIVEVEQRSKSPIRQALPQAFQGLRQKSSKGNIAETASNSKAMKMLGLTGGPQPDMPTRSPNTDIYREREFEQEHRYEDQGWRSQQQRVPRDHNYPPSSGRRTPGSERPTPNGRTTPHGNPSYEEFERHRQRSATPNSGRAPSAGRQRAPSAAASRSRSRQGGPYRDDENYPPHPDSRYSPPNVNNRHSPDERRGPTPNGYREEGRSGSAMGGRMRANSRPQGPGYFDNRGPPPPGMPPMNGPSDMGPRPSPRPPVPASPMSPAYAQPSPAFQGSEYGSAAASPMLPPGASSRKKSLNKGMISEPMFLSSTSSVPLVGLPTGGPAGLGPRPRALESPPIPTMNPERRRPRAGTGGQGAPSSLPGSALNSPMPPMNEHGQHEYAVAAARHAYDPHQQPMYNDPQQYGGRPAPRQRNRLRKISSEGGNMSARARQQAFRDEMKIENARSPAIGGGYGSGFDQYDDRGGPGRTRAEVFPNRSATSLGMNRQQGDGGMF